MEHTTACAPRHWRRESRLASSCTTSGILLPRESLRRAWTSPPWPPFSAIAPSVSCSGTFIPPRNTSEWQCCDTRMRSGSPRGRGQRGSPAGSRRLWQGPMGGQIEAAKRVRFLSAPQAQIAPFSSIGAERGRSPGRVVSARRLDMCRKRLEARVGIEPTYKGFADLSLTTWVPRPETALARGPRTKNWSGRRDLNPRLRPWQGRTLPLSYSRSAS